ncbi:profilin-1 [Diretmus argenteus]
MSWAQYVDKLKGPDDDGDVNIGEAAIVGYASGAESVWAASPALTGITPAEIKTLVGSDRMGFYSTGLVLGGMRCTVIRDLLLDKPFTMDLKTKATETDKSTYSVTIAKSNKGKTGRQTGRRLIVYMYNK